MASTYYAKVRVEGTNTPQCVQVQASGKTEAKRLVEGRVGEVKSWVNGPLVKSKPPSWFK